VYLSQEIQVSLETGSSPLDSCSPRSTTTLGALTFPRLQKKACMHMETRASAYAEAHASFNFGHQEKSCLAKFLVLDTSAEENSIIRLIGFKQRILAPLKTQRITCPVSFHSIFPISYYLPYLSKGPNPRSCHQKRRDLGEKLHYHSTASSSFG